LTLKYGIIGSGNFADDIVAPALKHAAGTALAGIYDIDPEKARSFASKHDVGFIAASLEALLESADIEAVYIAIPHKYHAKVAIQAAQAGKHIICEKPMALNVSDAEKMIKAAEKNKVKLGICYNSRYHPAHVEARRLIQTGAAGEIRLATVQGGSHITFKGWRLDPDMAGSGALTGPGIHCIDQLRFMLDSEVTEVQASMDFEPSYPGIDDMVYAVLKFAGGSRGTVASGIRIPRPDNHTIFYGSKAKIMCKDTGGLLPHGIGELIVTDSSISTATSYPVAYPSLVKSVSAIEAFNNWVERDVEPFITAANGLEMVKVTSAIVESARTGKTIKISR
jgi:1,5-anhydro-D-fructose reductase (1,5-anhydro-D-mannitol-forming)